MTMSSVKPNQRLRSLASMRPAASSAAMIVHPIQQIDYEALFKSLESGETGKVFEYLDHDKGDRFEVWVM